MSDNRFNKKNGEPTGDIYFSETVGPERYSRINNEQMKQKQAAQQAAINHPLFIDEDEIPTFNLGEDDYADDYNSSYDDGGGIYMNRPYQPQYQQQQQYYAPQYQQMQYPQEQYPQYQQPQYPEEPKRKKKKKKKHRIFKKLIITPLVALLTVAVVISVLAVGLMSKIDYNQVDLEQNQYIDENELHSSKNVINILFVGIDDDENGNSRSDSMMLISIDKKHKKIKLTSFLRDSWVDLPMKGKKAKLNAAYAANGVQGAVDTIEYNFLIDIDHYVMVDFEMFTQIIDAIGGVEVEVTEKEAKFIRETTRFKEMQSGERVRLSGAEALVYCRIRKLDTDYMRTYRQRKVITALMAQAKETDIRTLIDAMFEVFPLIQTDLDKAELLSVGFQGGYGLLAYEVQQTRAPIQEHMKESTINGQWVEVLELDKVRDYLYDFIYTDKIETDNNQ